jgi:hypothetical protein
MKNRILLLLLALLLGPAPLSAQLGGFEFKGGGNLSKFIGADAGETESKQGLRMGGSFALFNIGPISITPEIYYAQKGSKRQDAIDGIPLPMQLDLSLDYLEVPLLAKLSFPLGRDGFARHIRPYVAAGPAYAWRIGCEVRVVETNQELPDCGDVLGDTFGNARTAIRSADKGLVVNGGVALNVLDLGIVNLDARLVRGLDRISGGGDAANVKNQSFSLMLGYSFGVGGW